MYESDFRTADEGFYDGRVAETTRKREAYWERWCAYCGPLGLDPYLQDVSYQHQMRAMSGFAARTRTGFYGQGRQVQSGTVSGALTAVGTTIAMARGVNPTKVDGSDKLAPRLSQMMAGFGKKDGPTEKKLPVEVDVPELLVKVGLLEGALEIIKCIGDWALIAFYYLLRVGEYTHKGTRNDSKQTVNFKVEDLYFFKQDEKGTLRQLATNAPDADILTADGATLKLDNQKNGWKNVCVYHEHNGEKYLCPVRALGRRYVHIRQHTKDGKTHLSAYWMNGNRFDLTDKNMRESLKWAAATLEYPTKRGIPIERVDTHSLRGGGAQALSLNGYSETEIQKMGRWRGETFKEYVRENLHLFSAGMSKAMKRTLGFVNITGGTPKEVTNSL
jgi:hypothetical protein